MEIQRGNAKSVMGTAETSKDWDKYFLLLSRALSQDRGFVFLTFEEVFLSLAILWHFLSLLYFS